MTDTNDKLANAAEMNTTVHISYNTSINSHHPSAYQINFGSTAEPATETLQSVPPVWNNIAVTKGVFTKREDAFRAVLDYVSFPAKIIEFCGPDGVSYELWPFGKKPHPGIEFTWRSVAHKNTRGTWIAIEE